MQSYFVLGICDATAKFILRNRRCCPALLPLNPRTPNSKCSWANQGAAITGANQGTNVAQRHQHHSSSSVSSSSNGSVGGGSGSGVGSSSGSGNGSGFGSVPVIMEGPEVTFLFQFGSIRDAVCVPVNALTLKSLKDLACDFINTKVSGKRRERGLGVIHLVNGSPAADLIMQKHSPAYPERSMSIFSQSAQAKRGQVNSSSS